MNLSDVYVIDARTGFWRRSELRAFAYSDGDVVEQRILDIVRNCSDPSVFSDELAQAISDWPSQYHLGCGRINLLRPFRHLLTGSVLEIGCGCGAITRALGEFGADVVALEGSSVRAEIAVARCRGLDNVAVVCDSFDTFESAERFDVVTLIGVLEYARQYFPVKAGQDPVVATLARARAMLKPGGVLLLAIENQLGLKYFAGRPEDHNGVPMYGIEDLYGSVDAVTFGKQELTGLLSTAGWSHQRWWYPFPDYKFPISILSEAGVRTSADMTPLLQNSVVVDPQHGATSFSLESAWVPVFRNGLAGALANSFVVVASDSPLEEPHVLAYHYASARRESYACEIAFIQGEADSIFVQRRPLDGSSATASRSVDGLAVAFEEAEFVTGLHWQKELVRILNRPGWSIDQLRPWAATWFRAFIRHTTLEGVVLDKNTRIDGDHFDAVPRNLIVRAPDDTVFIDQEWKFNQPYTLGFLVFRSLGLSFFGLTSVASPAPQVSLGLQNILFELADGIGIPLIEEDLSVYIGWENEIQSRVGNRSGNLLSIDLVAQSRLNVRVACWSPENTFRLEAEINRKDCELVQQGAEIHRLEAMIQAKDERLRGIGSELAQQGAEIYRLEATVQAKDERLESIGRELENAQELLAQQDVWLTDQKAVAQRIEEERHYFYAEVAKRDKLLAEAGLRYDQLRVTCQTAATELQALKQTRWFQLLDILRTHPFGIRKVILLAATVGGGVVPRRWRPVVIPPLQRLLGLTPAMPANKGGDSNTYQVKVPPAAFTGAPKIVHAIANFMTGGSSRLVIDLVEYLGSQYHQSVLTSFNPDPPAYVGVEIEECRFPQDISPLVAYFQRMKPDIVHVHYWGDCDEPWYAKVISAAEFLGLPVIQNINTPVAPYRSNAVVRYVYVSDYVRRVFGFPGMEHVTVYPGSDFGLFTRSPTERAPEDCVGMVYRLERDKLNEDAIQPFIRIAQLRPQTHILIVGGGSLYEPYREAVRVAGVEANFEFTGYVSYEDLPALYRRMSLFVAPVWKESFGQVSPFAMSMKVPVIGYDIGAIGEIVDAPELLAAPADAEGLARIAVALLDSPEKIHRLGEMQQRRAQENFSIQAMIAHYAKIYAEVSEEARKDPA